jgi:ABC-type transport system involved in multi-copper enzyme maturation permease subunit
MKNKWKEPLDIVGAIAWKDIGDALKHKATRINILMMIGMVLFFYVMSTLRPWDRRIEAAVYDEADVGLFEGTSPLSDDYEMDLFEVSSFGQMQRNMRHERWGAVIPPDFDHTVASGGVPTIDGYILWRYRGQAAKLEAQYTEKFSELLDQPVRVAIGENIYIPSPTIGATMVNSNLLFVVLFSAVLLVPTLILEEKQTRTMDALMVSPASPGQVVAGKALAGLFYVVLTGGLFFVLHWIYITNWALALAGFLLCAAFSIGLALAIGSLAGTPQKMALWVPLIMILLIIPSVFADFTNLAPILRIIFSWVPTTALVNIFQFALSSPTPADQLLTNLGIALLSTTLVYLVVVWAVRRSDR